MQPWRPLQSVHIGLVEPGKHSFPEAVAAGASASGNTDVKQLYFQWCKLLASERESGRGSGGDGSDSSVGGGLPEDTAFSSACETTYVGVLFG